METEGLPEVVVFDVLGDRLVDGTVRSKTHQRWRHGNHIGELEKGAISQVGVPFLEDLLGVLKEPLVPFSVLLTALGVLFNHRGFVPDIVESISVAPDQSVHRLYFHELDVVLKASTRQLEQVGERMGCRDDGWASIEGEPFVFVNIGATAGKVPRFVQHCLDAC